VCAAPAGEEVPIAAQKGDVVIFSSLTLHRTLPNRTQADRWAYVIEYMSVRHFDPFIEPPYFLVSEDGRSAPRFSARHPGSLSRENVRLYWLPRMQKLVRTRLRRPLGRMLSGLRLRHA
jgi:hypothetical protein